MSKEFDVVVFGATGFTGALVARYMIQEQETAVGAQGAIKWALAGRNAKKLEQVKEELKRKVPSVSAASIDAIPTLIADSSNEAQLVEMVKKTKVVLTVVGPYKLYGEPLVKACAENGVHYCDLTGEVIWVDEMMRKYDAVAKRTGALIVNCCGFESVPSDLAVYVLADAVQKTKKSKVSKITTILDSFEGEASGGTLASVFTIMETATNKQLKEMSNPFFLTDDKTRHEKQKAGLVGPNSTTLAVKYEKDLNKWSSVHIGASVNQEVVHRSNYLLNNQYGEQLVYRERMAVGGLFMQLLVTIGVAIGSVLLYMRPTRAVIRYFAPKPGSGPSETMLTKGFFVNKSVAYDSQGQLAARATTVGSGDPGYMMTSKVLTECAICLAKGERTSANVKGGFYTPAAAFGHHLAKRLQSKKIMTIDVEQV